MCRSSSMPRIKWILPLCQTKDTCPLQMTHKPSDLGTTWGFSMRILMIEDDKRVADFVSRGLREHGHVVQLAENSIDGLFLATTERFDCVVVDCLLPGGGSGLDIVAAIRAQPSEVPVLILSALAEVDNRVEGLTVGADDYVTKPFAFVELVARIEALMRRKQPGRTFTKMVVADLELDPQSRQVKRAGQPISLLPREYRILEFLMHHAGQVVTRTMLLQAVWDCHFDPQTNVIDAHIAQLRRKLDKPFPTWLIQTVRGAGFMLSPSVV
jgi:two-component system OmpR family response regulator